MNAACNNVFREAFYHNTECNNHTPNTLDTEFCFKSLGKMNIHCEVIQYKLQRHVMRPYFIRTGLTT